MNAAVSTQSTQWAAAARLVRRTGFGASGPAVDAALKLGAAQYLATIISADETSDAGAIATPAPTFAPVTPIDVGASATVRKQRNQQISAQLLQLAGWWLHRMVTVQQPWVEKLTFCWHNHFATSAAKVRQANWLLEQNQTLRRLGRGDFRTLALAILTDAAMLRWLDGDTNTAAAPNENLSREFMELFSLGHDDGYTETDVREGARALTGWKIGANGSTFLRESLHDNGVKTFLGVTGNLGVSDYCDAVLAVRGSPAYIASRWWGQLASDTAPSAPTLAALQQAYGPSRDLAALFTAMFSCAEFSAARASLVIDPVEWVVGAVRTLRVPVEDQKTTTKLLGVLRTLGQIPFYPPNVSGWPAGQAWLSTAAADQRMQVAQSLVQAGDVSSIASASPSNRLEALGYTLGVAQWSARSAAVLSDQLSDPQRLVAIALNTPEYLVH